MAEVETTIRAETNAGSSRPLHLSTQVCEHCIRLQAIRDKDTLVSVCLYGMSEIRHQEWSIVP